MKIRALFFRPLVLFAALSFCGLLGAETSAPAKRIEIREGGYRRRQNWPYDATEWGATFKPGDSLCQPMFVHAPRKWWNETTALRGAGHAGTPRGGDRVGNGVRADEDGEDR